MSLASLRDRDGATRLLGIFSSVLLVVWLLWMKFGTLPIVATSHSARVEVEKRAARIDAPAMGRLEAVAAKMGASVKVGDILFTIDHTLSERKIEELRTRLATIEPEMQVVERVLRARGEVIAESNREMQSAVEEGRARVRSGSAASELADNEAERVKKLYASGSISEVEWLRSLSDADRKRAEKQALAGGVERVRGEFRTRVSYEKAKIEELRHELVMLETQKRSLAASIAVLEAEVQIRFVRSPVAGVLAEVAEINVGSVVTEGQRLCSVLPEGELRVVGKFEPSESLGRVRAGQRAVVRLDAFPWSQFGTVGAEVAEVAREVRDGQVLVTLAAAPPKGAITLSHGLTGQVEVIVDHVSPWELVRRGVGASLQPRSEGQP